MTLLAIIAPASPAAFAVSDPRRLSSWGSNRRLRFAIGPRGFFGAGAVAMAGMTVAKSRVG
jgi:hypothetical protein